MLPWDPDCVCCGIPNEPPLEAIVWPLMLRLPDCRTELGDREESGGRMGDCAERMSLSCGEGHAREEAARAECCVQDCKACMALRVAANEDSVSAQFRRLTALLRPPWPLPTSTGDPMATSSLAVSHLLPDTDGCPPEAGEEEPRDSARAMNASARCLAAWARWRNCCARAMDRELPSEFGVRGDVAPPGGGVPSQSIISTSPSAAVDPTVWDAGTACAHAN